MTPLATVAAISGGVRITAVDHAATAGGVAPGQPLADARAVLPGLLVADADPAGDRRALAMLADWSGRYTPWTAMDNTDDQCSGRKPGDGGLWLDITGCAHLMGGEAALLADLTGRLTGLGLAAVAAAADTPGAAWAIARFVDNGPLVRRVPTGETRSAIAPLPVAALRLPAATSAGLQRVGLRRVGDLIDRPRAPLAARFGTAVTTRLDQALGTVDEPLSPRRPPPALRVRLAFAEPIGRTEDIARATRHLMNDLTDRLAAARLGVRRLELAAYRADGTATLVDAGTSRPTRDPDHLWRLLRDKLGALDPGFGVDVMALAAVVADPLLPTQGTFEPGCETDDGIAQLVDRLGSRLGTANVVRLAARASHLPERACRPLPALAADPGVPPSGALAGDQRPRRPRPVHLLPSPEPIEVVAPVPDGPPALMRWRRVAHRIVAAEGPERIGTEWWLEDRGHDPRHTGQPRDYYRVELADGRRLWVFRAGRFHPGEPPRWYLHGVFP